VKNLTRRRFVQTSALASVGIAIAGHRVLGDTRPPRWELRKFAAALPGVGPAGIPLATANKSIYNQTGAQADFYRIVMGQYRQSFHPQLPSSRLWGYADATTGLPKWRYLGPAIVATAGTPVRVNFINLLPPVHPLPVDNTIMGAEADQKVNRAAVHLHGGFVPWPSDGGPYHWTTPLGAHGSSFVRWLPNRLGLPTDDCWYPNQQTARLMWYHDHAIGITRLNAYAGLAAPYLLVDAFEIAMFGPKGTLLPNQLPGIPLVLQDKSFKAVADEFGNVGDLDYPHSYGEQEPHPEEGGTFTNPLPSVSAVPEFFADNIVINGMAYPEVTLPAGAHRFRMLNGTQSRVFNLQLYRESPSDPGEVHAAPGPDFVVIGTEGGFLPRAAVVPSDHPMNVEAYYAHDPNGYGLVLAGAERADVLIDFSDCSGSTFILYNDAGSPFPDGADAFLDYFTGNPAVVGGPPRPGYGPNTRTMMRIRITNGVGQPMPSIEAIDAALAKVSNLGLLVPEDLLGDAFVPPPGAVFRNKTLNEGIDEYGRLIAMLGTDAETSMNFTKHGTLYCDAIDASREDYRVGTCEVWDVYNTTGDTHPIHFHLVNVQIIGRVTFATNDDGSPDFTQVPTAGWAPPDPCERGWKDTVRMDPGQITRVIMKIELPADPVVNVLGRNRTIRVPESPRTGGHEYVWHCHILEHEEHDMMRPFLVR
jgi:spore coat protein A